MSKLERFFHSLIWVPPILLGSIIYCLYGGIPPTKPICTEAWICSICISIFPPLWVYAQKDYLQERNSNDPGLLKAKYPSPLKEMLYDTPTGFCFGKHGNKYVCKRADEPGSILVQGSSGSAKSTSTIQTFLLNPENKKNVNTIVLDLKHELTDICVSPDELYSPENPEGNVIVLDPMDRRNGWGYDPFWTLDANSTEADVHEVMEVIANSLIPPGKGDSQVWSLAAQQFFRGASTFFYFYEKKRTLPAIIRAIKSKPIASVVEDICGKAKSTDCCYIDIISFHKMADETITSVDMNLSMRIVQFSTSSALQWCLESNPRRCNPSDLLYKSIYLCIPEDKLQQWAQLVFLIFNQFLTWMMGLPEKAQDPDRKYLAMILDETVALLAGIGAPMPLLSQCLRIGARGKGCTVLICCQSISGLYESMGKEQTKDLVANCQYKYILDSTDSDTTSEIISWCGKYFRRQISASGNGSKRKETTSYHLEDIMDEQELISLPKSEEAILVCNRAGYMRLKKVLSFKDPFFKYHRNLICQQKKER